MGCCHKIEEEEEKEKGKKREREEKRADDTTSETSLGARTGVSDLVPILTLTDPDLEGDTVHEVMESEEKSAPKTSQKDEVGGQEKVGEREEGGGREGERERERKRRKESG